MRNNKGGTFATDDIDLIHRALQVYIRKILAEEVEHPDIKKASNLLHRLGRIKG